MSDGFSAVDPHRLRQLADRLKDLADTLAREAPIIKKNFAEWDGTLSQSALSQQVSQVPDDARDMSKRADEALNLLKQPRFVDPNDPLRAWITIPWDVSKINTSYEATQEALELKQAMDNPNDPGSRETIQEVAQSLADHKDDPAYMQAFMANGGMDQAARAARVLHTEDGTHAGVVLSKGSEAILADFGQGVQSATSMAAQGKITLPPNALDALTKPAGGDMWSVAMLFKYGPNGAAWDPDVLSQVGGAMLTWREKNQVNPDYSAPSIESYGAGGYMDPDNAWYSSLGLGVDYSHGSKGTPDKINGIMANDPTLALMQRVSENAEASRKLLSGSNGAQYAKDLTDYKWAMPGPTLFDETKYPAAVITAATSDRKDHGQESAEAAANIVAAGAFDYDAGKNANGFDKDQYQIPSPGITHALAQVFATYTPDFAYSTDGKSDGGAYAIQPQADGPWMIHVSRDTMKDFLSNVMQVHADGNNVVNAVNAQVALTVARGTDSEGAKAYLSDLGELRGEVSVAGSRVKYDAASQTDADHTNDIKWLNVVGGFIASVPSPELAVPLGTLPADYAKAAIWGGLPIASAAFSTDNADTVDESAQTTVFDDYSQMRVSVVQGLVLSGKIQPPPNHPEWANGNITFRPGTNDEDDFESWWTGVAQSDPAVADLYKTQIGNGFLLGSARFKSH
jgi:hypothetical protein